MKKLLLLTLCAIALPASLRAAQGGRDTKTSLTKKQKAAAAAKEREEALLLEQALQKATLEKQGQQTHEVEAKETHKHRKKQVKEAQLEIARVQKR